MATVRENLVARMENIGVELRDVKNTDRHWSAYKQGLYDELARLTALLEAGGIDQDAAGGDTLFPFEAHTTGIT